MARRALLSDLRGRPLALGLARIDAGSELADEREHLGVDVRGARVHRARRDADLGGAHDLAHLAALLGEHQRDDVALVARAGGAARSVQVRLVLDGRVDVHDEVDAVDVHAASRDVGGDEHARLAADELGEVAVARVLRQVALQLDRGDAGGGELLGELLRLVLHAREEDAAGGARGERLDERVLLLLARDLEDVVGELRHGRLGGVDGVQDRVVQVLLHDVVHAVVERRAEEQALALLGRGVENARDDGQEAHVGHVVGLVEHGDLHRAEIDESLLHEVVEAAGGCDDDVDAALERDLLAALRHAAEDGRHLDAHRVGQHLQRLGDLRDEFAGRCEHDGARAARAALPGGVVGEVRDEGDAEGDGLAGAGAPAAEHVAAGERVGEGVALDREGRRLAVLGEGVGDGGGDPELLEGGRRGGGLFGHGDLSCMGASRGRAPSARLWRA